MQIVYLFYFILERKCCFMAKGVLTEKQKLFVEEYLKDLNATQAAIRAGYNKKNARIIACQNLTKLNIQEYLTERMKAREKRTEITQDMIIKELSKIAFSNATDYVTVETKPLKVLKKDPKTNEEKYVDSDVMYQDIIIKDTKDMTDDQKAAIGSIKHTKYGVAIDSLNKIEALHLLGQHLGMFKNNQPINVINNIPDNPYNGLSVDELKALAQAKIKQGDENASDDG